jgi:hypothetical protein
MEILHILLAFTTKCVEREQCEEIEHAVAYGKGVEEAGCRRALEEEKRRRREEERRRSASMRQGAGCDGPGKRRLGRARARTRLMTPRNGKLLGVPTVA